jgi:hypothetical protein
LSTASRNSTFFWFCKDCAKSIVRLAIF